MNKRIRKKKAKQAWEQMMQEIRDPAFWQRSESKTGGWAGYVATSSRKVVIDGLELHVLF